MNNWHKSDIGMADTKSKITVYMVDSKEDFPWTYNNTTQMWSGKHGLKEEGSLHPRDYKGKWSREIITQ